MNESTGNESKKKSFNQESKKFALRLMEASNKIVGEKAKPESITKLNTLSNFLLLANQYADINEFGTARRLLYKAKRLLSEIK